MKRTSVRIKKVWIKQLCSQKVWDFATAFQVRKLFGTFEIEKRAPSPGNGFQTVYRDPKGTPYSSVPPWRWLMFFHVYKQKFRRENVNWVICRFFGGGFSRKKRKKSLLVGRVLGLSHIRSAGLPKKLTRQSWSRYDYSTTWVGRKRTHYKLHIPWIFW